MVPRKFVGSPKTDPKKGFRAFVYGGPIGIGYKSRESTGLDRSFS